MHFVSLGGVCTYGTTYDFSNFYFCYCTACTYIFVYKCGNISAMLFEIQKHLYKVLYI